MFRFFIEHIFFQANIGTLKNTGKLLDVYKTAGDAVVKNRPVLLRPQNSNFVICLNSEIFIFKQGMDAFLGANRLKATVSKL